MNKNVGLLDCTLRDGGYVNDWDFGHSVIADIYKRLDMAGVDYIEVGFLDDRRSFDINRTIMPSTEALNRVYANIPKKHAIPVAMIDFGTCALEHIDPCESAFIDGIRVIFKKEKIESALPFCKAIKDKGYKLFIQAISITAYSDLELLEYVQQINEIKPYVFSIVDTYGLLDKEKLTKIFYLIDNNLDPDIKLGYHAHNNFQLGFSNTIEFLSMKTKRDLIADATVYGMGKSAGNCATELLSMHMNQYYEKKYIISDALEIIDTDLMAIYRKQYWGYTYMYYISALHDCHPNYVKYLLDKKTLSVSSVNEILSNIPNEKRLLYSEQYISEAYIKYQKHAIDDTDVYKRLNEQFQGQKLLLLGPGKTIALESIQINQFIDTNSPIVISVNFETDLYCSDYIFISNSKRYSKLVDMRASKSHETKLIATSNIRELDYPIHFRLNYESLLLPEVENPDNALVLLLSFLIKMNVKEIFLAGFDGYAPGVSNYYKRGYSFASDDSLKEKRNLVMSETLTKIDKKLRINFITSSLYKLKEGEE